MLGKATPSVQATAAADEHSPPSELRVRTAYAYNARSPATLLKDRRIAEIPWPPCREHPLKAGDVTCLSTTTGRRSASSRS